MDISNFRNPAHQYPRKDKGIDTIHTASSMYRGDSLSP